jgi:hypothetical protein
MNRPSETKSNASSVGRDDIQDVPETTSGPIGELGSRRCEDVVDDRLPSSIATCRCSRDPREGASSSIAVFLKCPACRRQTIAVSGPRSAR